jgi:hypothetical protein
MMRYCPKSNGAPMAQTNLRYHWNFPRAGDSAKERAITPIADRAFYRARIALHSLCATSAPPSATLGSAPLSPRTLGEERAIADKPECGVWSVRHRFPYFPCTAGDSAEPLDSPEASVWCQAARPHSNASTASGAASAMAIGPALAPKPTTDAINARLISLSCDMSPVCLSADGPFVPSSVCVSGRTASALGPPACRAGLAKSPAGPGRVKRVGDRSLQDPARTISASYPPAELNFIAKIFRKNLRGADIAGN